MCCPRKLDRQINLVRAVAARLKALDYQIAPPGSESEDSPDLKGSYDPSTSSELRSAIRSFKKRKNLKPDDDITYELVEALLGTNLFERWKVR
jgi:hypothetical protein